MKRLIPIALISLLALASMLHAQTDLRKIMQKAGGSVLYGLDGEILHARTTINPPSSPLPVVEGAPFIADSIGENVQILGDGNRITRAVPTGRLYRDSYGRTRTDQAPFLFAPAASTASKLPIVSEIFDPVSGYQYFLDTENRIAHRFMVPDYPESIANRILSLEANPPGGESLGTREIEGLPAEGFRRSLTIPSGTMGNDQPIVNITETWFSPDLQLTILNRTTSSSSEQLKAYVNIERVEPDPALFKIPEGYTVVEEKDAFTITFGVSE